MNAKDGGKPLPYKPRITAYMTEWMDDILAKCAEEQEVKERAAFNGLRLRAIGLASGDPEHLDEYAIEALLDPDVVRDALSTDAGARLGLMMEGQLRSSGELDRVRAAWVTQDVWAVIKASIAAGSMSDAVACKLVDGLTKLNARGGEKPEATKPPPPFTGTAAELVTSLMDSPPSRASLPFKPTGSG